MKIDPHAALLAAQNLRTQDPSPKGRQAAASFFAELQKSSGTGQRAASMQASTNADTATAQTKSSSTLREAPMRKAEPTGPVPPGSLLNILV